MVHSSRINADLPASLTWKNWNQGAMGKLQDLSAIACDFIHATAKGAGGTPGLIKTLCVKPFNIGSQWALLLGIKLPTPLANIAADMSKVKGVLDTGEWMLKVKSVFSTETKRECVAIVPSQHRHRISLSHKSTDQTLLKVAKVAGFLYSTSEAINYLQSTSLLRLGSRVMWGVSALATVSSIVASAINLRDEYQFFKTPPIFDIEGEQATVIWQESVLSVIKMALHISTLAVGILFAMPLVGYTFAQHKTAKLVAATAFATTGILQYYWKAMVTDQLAGIRLR